ncbi:acetate/propionate family kinase [Pseudochelatococcus contaminans]|uniref:Acetate kinase n=1 Tax=Pseudochelatococcus contaminans TaxID=1538103 RepID=A0A7W5Z708_9HYPH|nr:acetate/propionate family kinase [Pseudochelatococcus contaminans]MBB3810676.1 acetate kinase [Pseudochelatococcus contaminans]
MTDAIIVINSGSTSLKFGIYELDADKTLPLIITGGIDNMSTQPHFIAKTADGKPIDAKEWGDHQPMDHKKALTFIIDWLKGHEKQIEVKAAGHRVVLGGTRFAQPTVLTAEIIDYLDDLKRMEPSHQAYEVLGARAVAEVFPGLPQVAVFDSSFHRTMPEVAQIYALPKKARDTGVRHWGYHGISYDYIHRQVPKHAPDARRVIVGHLGGGASVCAILDGKSIETSMAFAGLTGLPMSTRSGDVPADVLFYLVRSGAYDIESLEKALYADGGLLGLSGISGDMQELQASADPNAKLAVDYFVYVLVKTIGAYTALLGGLDALVFTAGIGENSSIVRAAVVEKLEWLGLKIDSAANNANNIEISTPDSKVKVLVIPTNEELMIAHHTFELTHNNA